MGTRKTTRGTRTKLATSVADLRSVVRLDSDNLNAFSFSLVLDEALQLIEAPVANPIVHPLSSSLFSDTFEVFHYDLVSTEIGNNVFTDVMINPSHVTSFPSRDFTKQSLTGFCAFCLESRTQILELPFCAFDFCRIIKPAVRSDSEVIYSAVNTKNSILDIRAFGINCFRECEQEEASAFFINFEETLRDFPTEIFSITVGDSEGHFNSAFDCGNAQDIVFEGSRSREVIAHGTSIDNWFGFSLFDHSAGLLDTSDSQLALQPITFNGGIDKRMEFDVIPNLHFPSLINTELQSFSIHSESLNYLRSCRNLNFGCCSDVHNEYKTPQIFKCIGGEFNFLPQLKLWEEIEYVL